MSEVYYIIMIAIVLFIVLFIFMYLSYKHLIQKIEKQRRENIQSMIDVQERERRIIALEVHDNLGPLLSITSMQIEAALENIPDGYKKQLEEAHEQLKNAVEMCRNISHDLTPFINTGNSLPEILEEYIRRLRKTKLINIDFKYALDKIPIAQQASASICRIVLELITNTVKHAHAKNICINIARQQQTALIHYYDDGIGMQHNQSPGIGIKNIQSRVQILNGVLQIGQPEHSGIDVKIKIPIKNLNNV